jgi:ribosome maturation factor RimP
MAKLAEDLVTRLERLAQSEGMELLAVEVGGTARRPVVRLILDRDAGGVSLGDCENLSRQASLLFDAYDPFPSAFTLEVSSPGLDRKLYRDKDFTRFAGAAVRVRMKPTWPPPRVVEGTLVGRSGGHVRVLDGTGVERLLPEGEVFDTRLVPQLEPAARKRGRT